jgi:hypothetical protein
MNLKLDELFDNCAYKVVYTQVGDSVNYAFVEEGDTLYIYFQGSNSISDWVRNFWFFKKPYKNMKISYYVHGGFLSAWKEVEDIISNKILEKVPLQDGHYDYKFKKIISVGYSHGGALSGLCHEFVWFNRPDIRNNIFGVGFESPRFYHGLFVNKKLKERWENYIVIRNHFDIVTFLPPRLFLFTHVGTVCTLNQTSTVNYKKPKCIGAHYPDKVLESLREHYKK